MDLSHLDSRAAADRALEMKLCHPVTREPLGSGDDCPRLLVRGVASKSAQDRLSEILEAKSKSKNAKKTKDEDRLSIPEYFHQKSIEAALPYIVGSINCEVEGQEVGDDPKMIRRLLDLTYPSIDAVEQDDGTRKQDYVNWPFAKQVIEFAGEQERFFGNSPES